MSNLTITNIDTSSLIVKDGEFEDGTLAFGSPTTILAGTILARDSVSLKYVVYTPGIATNEHDVAKAVLSYELVIEDAADVPVRPMITGVVRKDKLVIEADGDDSNVDALVRDQLRDYNIAVVDVNELGQLDNQ
jgi:hypothetical protein